MGTDPIFPIKGVLFDLDGTLLDTAGDLAAAANRMLAALKLPRRTRAEVASYVGKGIPRLVERCITGQMDGKVDPTLLEQALSLYASAYAEESGRQTTPYPGVLEGLEGLKSAGLHLGCVTNKKERFTLPLLEQMGLLRHFSVVVSGDSVARSKPDPLPYAHACERLGLAPAEVIAVGDSENDVVSARAAGLRVLCVTYGYREGRSVEELGADAVIADLREVTAWLSK